ncbi:MAG: TRAP transporter small permease subunit [Planctomycetota bacterium]
MRAWLRLSFAIDRLNRGIARAVAWLALAMVLIGAYNAIARFCQRSLGMNLSSNAYLEAQWYLFSVLFLLGAPYALRKGSHVRVDVLYAGHPLRGRAWTDLLGTLLLLLPFCGFAIWTSWDFVADSIAKREMSNDPGGLPRWPLKPIVPMAFLLLALQGISEAIKRVALLRGWSPAATRLDETSAHTAGAT